MEEMMTYQQIPVTIQIGKQGITDEIIDEVKKQLKKRKLIKIRLLKSFVNSNDRKEAFQTIAKKTSSELVHSAGFVFCLKKGNPPKT